MRYTSSEFGLRAKRNSAHEVWSSKPNINAKEVIDSFGKDIGRFNWQVAVIRVSEERGFEGVISDWSAVQSLERVRHISPEAVPYADQSDAVRWIR